MARTKRNKSNLIQVPTSNEKPLPLVLKDNDERRYFLQILELFRVFDMYFKGLLELGFLQKMDLWQLLNSWAGEY